MSHTILLPAFGRVFIACQEEVRVHLYVLGKFANLPTYIIAKRL